MFIVFEDVLKGKYKRTVVVKDGQQKSGKSHLEKIEGPVEAHGIFVHLYELETFMLTL